MTTTQLLLLLLALCLVVCIGLCLALAKHKYQYRQLIEDIKPYPHWCNFRNGIYAIPLTTKLYQPTASGGYEPIGTVADHFTAFSKSSLEEVLEDAFYGTCLPREYIGVKILSANCESNAVTILSISGERFVIMRNESPEFPTKLKLEFTQRQE